MVCKVSAGTKDQVPLFIALTKIPKLVPRFSLKTKPNFLRIAIIWCHKFSSGPAYFEDLVVLMARYILCAGIVPYHANKPGRLRIQLITMSHCTQ